MAIREVPPAPVAPELRNAHLVLKHTHSTVDSFFDAFQDSVQQRGRGAPTDQEYDQLRAMLVFACSGLDSSIKHAVRDALPAVIDRVDRAADNFRDFVEKQLPLDTQSTTRLLADVLTTPSPRSALIQHLVRNLTGRSLQSKDQILRAGSFFDIPSSELIDDMALFDEIFRARNQIAHEMDIDFTQPRRNRARRPRQKMVGYTAAVLGCAANFLAGVDSRLKP